MNFGDVVKYDNKLLVFLGATPDIIYFAWILDVELSKRFISLRDKRYSSTPMAEKSDRLDFYCFIELTTESFRQRIAHYALRPGESEYSLSDYVDTVGSLNADDKKKLKAEITNDGAISQQLQDLVKPIKLD
jgi:hypothetical protein